MQLIKKEGKISRENLYLFCLYHSRSCQRSLDLTLLNVLDGGSIDTIGSQLGGESVVGVLAEGDSLAGPDLGHEGPLEVLDLGVEVGLAGEDEGV
ncbi:50S ribosomal protein L2, chloroplastic, partial [Frankliniella fusca]